MIVFDIITIGTASRDVFIKSSHLKEVDMKEFTTGKGICLPFGAKLDVDDMVFSTGGGGVNMAVTFARQGFKTACVCKTGQDVSGREVVANLQAENIDTRFVITDKALKTAYSMLLLSGNGERTILVFRGASENLEVKEMNWPPLNTRWFYLSGALSLDVINTVLDKAQAIGARVAMSPSARHFDIGLAGMKDVLGRVDVFIMNRAEGSKLTSISYDNEKDIFTKLDDYVKGIVVMTEGPQGVMVSDGKKMYRAGVFAERTLRIYTGPFSK